MRKNKGFSLVELIIVIAIMAILVGVMAPQLIKYIEKSKVSSDTQLCSTVQTAVTTALSDPEVNDWNGYDTKFNTWCNATAVSALSTTATDKLDSSVLETLGEKTPANINSSLKSYQAKSNGVSFQIIDANSVSVWIPNTDASGSKGKNSGTASSISVD
ncbi:MAG: type II secretion system protein [Lachnospiraceae bacterium]|nr:type II secretion system protein [Lachnospiraceae bacterium]